MGATWVVYALIVSLPLGAGLVALERGMVLARLPVRWGWAIGMGALVALLAVAPMRFRAPEIARSADSSPLVLDADPAPIPTEPVAAPRAEPIRAFLTVAATTGRAWLDRAGEWASARA